MSYQFYQATLDLARVLTDVRESFASGGNYHTVEDDTNVVVETSKYYNGGTIWLPEAELATPIINYLSLDTGVPNTFLYAITPHNTISGDPYAVANADYPLRILNQAVRNALVDIGAPIEQVVQTNVTVAGQVEYNFPNTTTGIGEVLRIEISQKRSSDVQYTTEIPYYIHRNWRQMDRKIQFDNGHEPAQTGYNIRYTYRPPLEDDINDNTIIDPQVNRLRLKWEAAVYALRWRVQRVEDDKPAILRLLNEAIANAAMYKARYPMPEIGYDSHLAGW